MSNSLTLKIDAAFLIHGRGFMVIPVIPLPKMSDFKPFKGNIEILLPDGIKKVYPAQFSLEHFTYIDLTGKWRLVILLQNVTKNDVPDGSEMIVSEEIASLLQLG